MPHEIERKFLIGEMPPSLKQFAHADIDQGYLAIGANGREVRLRKYGDRLLLTAKSGEGRVRQEVEIAISAEQFDALWPLTAGRRIYKTRYKIPHGALTIELDVYRGKHSGFAVAEVEFESEEACANFQPPPWFGEDVSGVPRYSNRELARE